MPTQTSETIPVGSASPFQGAYAGNNPPAAFSQGVHNAAIIKHTKVNRIKWRLGNM